MTIDEAIEVLKNCGYLTNREEKQIAEWLEELKMLRLVENGYNKAIDDFVLSCEKQLIQIYMQRCIDMRDIRMIAEQLKRRDNYVGYNTR